MKKVYPLVLCGGMGSRLWPMSRIDQPKQFQPVNGKGSLTYFQTTVQRHRSPLFHKPIVVTNANQAELVTQQLVEIQTTGRIIGEPVGRNTGPAVLAAALMALRDDPEAVLLVLPSDHIIKGDLNRTVAQMLPAADQGRIITFGVRPTYAETGYGYIIDGGEDPQHDGLHAVERFIEKPQAAIARQLIDDGMAYWASGISMFRADVIAAEFRRLDPQTHTAVTLALSQARIGYNGLVLEEKSFRSAQNEPTERLVFEHSAAVSLAPIEVQWDDVGAWPAVYDVNPKSDGGNVTNGDVMTLDTTNSLIRSDGRLVVVIGMKDLIVVDTKDALLVTDREHAQQVKQAVDQLKCGSRAEVMSHPYRSFAWGRVETLATEPDYRLEMVVVNRGASTKVKGRAWGSRLLSIVHGQASFRGDQSETEAKLSRGSVLTIDTDTEITLTNTGDHEVRAMLLSTVASDVDLRDKALAQPHALRAVANG